MKRLIFATVFIFLVQFGSSQAEEISPIRQKSLELMAIIGGEDMVRSIMDTALAQSFELARAELNPDARLTFDLYAQIARESVADMIPEFTIQIASIYERHFTIEEMDAIIEFYKSPVGEKLVTKLPELTSESIIIGTEFGEKLTKRLTTIELPDELND
ncbi:MAG: DUF2059 domain-containing protein [Pseudomonadota bacterium]